MISGSISVNIPTATSAEALAGASDSVAITPLTLALVLSGFSVSGSTSPSSTDKGYVNVVSDYGAVADGDILTGSGTDNHAAFQAALSSGKKVFVPPGVYRIHGKELLNHIHGQVIEGSGPGWGTFPAVNYSPHTTLLFTGTGERYVKTRRKARATSADPQDSPISAAVNIQGEGVTLRDLAIVNYCDYTNTASTNFGDDWDVGLLEGAAGLKTHNVTVLGYWRVAGHLRDVTKGFGLPVFTSPSSIAYPQGKIPSGVDTSYHYNLRIIGGRWGQKVHGATNNTTNYYDAIASATLSDTRGNSGASDFVVFGGQIHGPMHHSGHRWTNALASLNNTSEGDSSGAVWIDAWANLAAERISKQTYYSTRFVSEEPYTVRLDRVGNIRFNDCHFEWSDRSVVPVSGGSPIDPSDTANYGYGVISKTSKTGTVHINSRSTNGPSNAWFWDVVGSTGNYSAYDIGADDGTTRIQVQGKTVLDIGATAVQGADSSISSTITWDGTAPSGTTSKRYAWSRVGNLVYVQMRLEYSTAGSGNTTLTVNFPSDLPTPLDMSGQGSTEISFAAAGNLVHTGSGWTGGAPLTTRCLVSKTSASGWQVKWLAASNTNVGAYCSFSYIAAD